MIATGTPEEVAAGPPTIVIHHFRMNSSRAALESASLELFSDLRVDTIELRDIRGTPREVGQAIAREVLEETAKAAAIELMKAKAAQKLEQLFDRKILAVLKLFMQSDEDLYLREIAKRARVPPARRASARARPTK